LVERINGMFAFALWDERRARLLVARDRVGKKPLYYCDRGGELSFASELAALVEDPAVPRELDPSSLDVFLAFGYIQAPYTVWRGVRKLPPAHTLVWQDGKTSVERYWRLDYSQKITGERAELEGELRERIAASVRRRMIADVPLGAFLSGGIDSSIVVSEMAAASAEPVKTFSIGFEHERYNELPNARLIADRFSTEHTEFTVQPDAVDLLPTLVRHYGEPYADSSAIPSFYLAELTRRHVTVALNGDGGDESFAGYLRHPANALSGWIDHVPVALRRGLADLATRAVAAREQRSARAYARRYLTTIDEPAPDRYAAHVGILDGAERREILDSDLARAVDPARAEAVIHDPWATATGSSRLDVLLQTDVETYLPGDLLTKMDVATMAYSLEARSPLLDPEVMEFAASLSPSHKARWAQKKRVLRDAYRYRLPAEILDGPKKGFGVPLADWFRGELSGWVREMLLDPQVAAGGLVEASAVERIVTDHQDGRGDRASAIWALLCLEQWRREFAS
ncbi:MAG: asparagine synthase (glutamine-hydrolyzing), partial [Solirubrobacterales bacterium]